MTAIMMGSAGSSAAAGAGGVALETTITVGQTTYDAAGTSTFYYAFGYASGVDRLGLANTGSTSVNPAQYTDGGSNSRTISAIYYTEVGGPTSEDDNLYFCLNATSIADTDTTFVSIDYNSVNYTRASANIYSGTLGSCSSWQWSNINPNGPTGGTPTLIVNI